jgi:hypothetical protein
MSFFLELRSQFYKTVFSVFHYQYGLKIIVQIIVKDGSFWSDVNTTSNQCAL